MINTTTQYKNREALFNAVCEQPTTGTVQSLLARQEALDALIGAVRATPDPPTVQTVTTADIVTQTLDSFPVKSRVADLQERGQLQLHTRSEPVETSLLVSDDQVITVLPTPEGVIGVRIKQPAVAGPVHAWFNEQWQTSSAAGIDTPSLSQLTATVAEQASATTAETLTALVDAAEDMPPDAAVTDGAVLTLLAAAATSEFQHDVWRSTEAVGLASKSKITRKKQALRDAGVITTEHVPVNVGRPRIRLHLADAAPETPTDHLDWVGEQLAASASTRA